MTINHHRNVTNRCNALKSTGPRSVSGRRASSQNSRKHGLNSAPDFESSIEYQKLVDLIYGGGEGIRDPCLLEAALFRPQTGYYPTLIDEASALWESLS